MGTRTRAELGAPLGGWRADLGPSTMLDTTPFVGGYGMRGGVVLDDGTVVLPLCDIPEYRRVFVVRSTDGGAIWSTAISAASLPGRWFEEPAPLLLRSGRLLLLLRENASRTLWRTWSDDGGLTWADPEPTGIDGYPLTSPTCPTAASCALTASAGSPYAIRAVLSDDDGASWTTTPTEIRLDLPSRDLGYPCTLPAADGLDHGLLRTPGRRLHLPLLDPLGGRLRQGWHCSRNAASACSTGRVNASDFRSTSMVQLAHHATMVEA